MTSPTAKTKKTPAITPRQKFEGHTDDVWGVVHLPGGQRIITCSHDGSLRVWILKSGKQIGEDWRDGKRKMESKALSQNGKTVVSGKQTGEESRNKFKDNRVWSIALSPDGTKVVSGSGDGAVMLWDVDTGKVIAKWTGHKLGVGSVYWSRNGRTVLSGSDDGTVRQWDVEGETRDGETILALIKTGHQYGVWAVVYSPDMSLIATAGWDRPETEESTECSNIQIWNAKTGKLVTTLKGHTEQVRCLAWTKDGKTLISGSYDNSIMTWNTTKWEQIAILDVHAEVFALAISPNDRILASALYDRTTRLWNLDNNQPISLPLQHAEPVNCVSFSADGKLLATGCRDKNAYLWDVAAIIKEAGLDELLLHSKVS
jgi:WD40 repeat protein